jgi:hypothetical protein
MSAETRREVVDPPVADERPGVNPRRIATLMRAALDALDLDLDGRWVVTEAATGAYAVTPVLAAMAGAAQVEAIARDTPYGRAEDAVAAVRELAAAVGVGRTIRFAGSLGEASLERADIVTNSGSVRPIDARATRRMRPGSAVPLMYEAWEIRAPDVDLEACRRRGIRVSGTNERHPAVDVFSYHGMMAARLLTDAGIAVHGSRVLVLCDNAFAPYLVRGLHACGADVGRASALGHASLDPPPDAVLVALRPCPWPTVGHDEAMLLAGHAPGAVVVQYWGDVDRDVLHAAGVPVWPRTAPPDGHMAILPSAIGPEPIVRLQAAGLKVGELLCRRDGPLDPASLDLLQPL